jgi:hypothetical protein
LVQQRSGKRATTFLRVKLPLFFMDNLPDSTKTLDAPSDATIRDYAYQLYEQGDHLPGHEVDHWLEAIACLKAKIPARLASTRLHRYLDGPWRGDPSLLSVEMRILSA